MKLKLFIFLLYLVFSVICVADEANFNRISNELKEFKEKFGYVPTDVDYFKLICKNDANLTLREQGVLWAELIKLQHPSLRLEEIKKILIGKQNSIKSFKCKFVCLHSNKVNPKDAFIGNTEFEYAVKYPYFFLKTKYTNSDKQTSQLYSYDGDEFIDLTNIDGRVPNARVSKLTDYSIAFCPYSPFAQSMLYDSINLNSTHPGFDFVALFTQFPDLIVFEKKEIYNNHECIVVANLGHRFLLDTNCDFSLVKYENYFHHSENTSEGPKTIKRTLLSCRTLNNLKDYGNGIWIPSEIQNVYKSPNEEEIGSDTIHCSYIEINKVADTMFKNVVPDNAIVFNSIRNMSYIQRDGASINSLLKDVVKSKRVFFYRCLSVSIGLAMIIIAVVVKYLRHRKMKKNEA